MAPAMAEIQSDQWVNIKELAARYAAKLDPGFWGLRRAWAQDRLVGKLVKAFMAGRISGFADENVVSSYQRKEFDVNRFDLAGRVIVNAGEAIEFSRSLWREDDSKGVAAAFNGATRRVIFRKAVEECKQHDGSLLRDRCAKFQHWGFHARQIA